MSVISTQAATDSTAGHGGNGRRIKVCHVLYGLGIGGIETLAVKLFNRMDRSRFEHVVINLTPADDLVSEIEPGAARLYFLNKGPGSDLRIFPEITRIMLQERPDVVHTRNWTTLIEGVVPSIAARVSGRVHSFDGLNADNLGEEPARRIWAQRLLLKRVQKIVARSEAMRDAMAGQLKLDPSTIQLIADGIDLARYDKPVDRNAIRARFGIEADDRVVGIVARLDPVKDHRTLFRAVARVVPEVPNLKVMVVGGGPIEAELRSEVNASPYARNIVFTGPQLDVPSLYHAMDYYAQPSLYEGVSGSILEAMSAYLPVLSTAVGGTVDIVKEDFNGHLVPSGDDAGLASGLLKLIRSPEHAKNLGRNGRKFVEDHYSLARVLELYSQVYSQACGRRWDAHPGQPTGA